MTLNGHQINERVKLAKMKSRWNLIKFKINEINDGTLSSSYDLRSSNLTSDDPRWSQIVLKDQEQDHDDRQQLFNRLSFQLLAQLQLRCNWCDLWNDTSFIFSPIIRNQRLPGSFPEPIILFPSRSKFRNFKFVRKMWENFISILKISGKISKKRSNIKSKSVWFKL